jgi:hypothetical protein
VGPVRGWSEFGAVESSSCASAGAWIDVVGCDDETLTPRHRLTIGPDPSGAYSPFLCAFSSAQARPAQSSSGSSLCIHMGLEVLY